MLSYWSQLADPDTLWIAFGGKAEDFDGVPTKQKIFISSNRIRVLGCDARNDRQCVFQAFAEIIASRSEVGFVNLAECDLIPLVQGVNELQISKLNERKADMIGYDLSRVDRTISAFHINHRADGGLQRTIQRISVREDKDLVLRMVGYGGFWRRDAFLDTASVAQTEAVYTELWMPTIAHHLGYRVVDNEQPCFSYFMRLPKQPPTAEFEQAKKRGDWYFHPHKSFWERSNGLQTATLASCRY
jgi:hypothetical protein